MFAFKFLSLSLKTTSSISTQQCWQNLLKTLNRLLWNEFIKRSSDAEQVWSSWLMIDGLWRNTSPCQESLGADYVDVAVNVASLWLSAGSLQHRQKIATVWWKQYSQAVSYTMGSSFLSFCQQKLCLSPALWYNLSIVCNVGLYKQYVQSLQCTHGNTIVGSHL